MDFCDILLTERTGNPVDIIEVIAALNDWDFHRQALDEIAIGLTGRWANYDASFSWVDGAEALHLSCCFDLKVPEHRLSDVRRLVGLVNENLLSGHFDYWAASGVVIYRQSHSLAGGAEPNNRQIESMLATACDSCERYYPAFQFALWAGRRAEDALACSLFETFGEA